MLVVFVKNPRTVKADSKLAAKANKNNPKAACCAYINHQPLLSQLPMLFVHSPSHQYLF